MRTEDKSNNKIISSAHSSAQEDPNYFQQQHVCALGTSLEFHKVAHPQQTVDHGHRRNTLLTPQQTTSTATNFEVRINSSIHILSMADQNHCTTPHEICGQRTVEGEFVAVFMNDFLHPETGNRDRIFARNFRDRLNTLLSNLRERKMLERNWLSVIL
jgi:hypothetical protein